MNERGELKGQRNRSQQDRPLQFPGLLNRGNGGGSICEGRVDSGTAAALAAMKDPAARTKVVVRHLPPSLSEATFLEQIHSRFAAMYEWVIFHPGKISHKGHVYSRAYIDFKWPEDVMDFYEAFDGHVFLNEKGTQYRASVEYAPYQRVPRLWRKKDMWEGTMLTDSEYLEFLEQLAKPIEYLPSAEVQLERKEVEKAAILATSGVQEGVTVTPLMDFVRQKRAAKAMPQRSVSMPGKWSTWGGGSVSTASRSALSKRLAVRSRASTIYIPSQIITRSKEKSAYIQHQEVNQCQDWELAIEKEREVNLEVKGKKLVQEVGSPKLYLDNYLTDTSNDISFKNIQDIVLDSVTVSISASEVEEHRLHLCGKVPPSIGEKAGEMGQDVSEMGFPEKKQLLLRKKDEFTINGLVAGSLVRVGSDSSGSASPKAQALTLFRSVPEAQAAVVIQQGATLPGRGVAVDSGIKQRQHWEAVGQFRPVATLMSIQQSSLQRSIQFENFVVDKQSKPQNLGISPNDTIIPPYETETTAQQNDLSRRICKEEKNGHKQRNGSFIYGGLAERQEGRRVKNKGRSDHPVWTVRHRAESIPTTELSSSPLSLGAPSKSGVSTSIEGSIKLDKAAPQKCHMGKLVGSARSVKVVEYQSDSVQHTDASIPGNCRHTRHDHNSQYGTACSDVSKTFKQMGGSLAFGHEKQVWVAKSGSGS